MYFEDRIDAARRLGDALRAYRERNPLVLAIPRGAVPMGERIAADLGGELDVVLVRKLGAPGNPELAVGSVDESGRTYVADFARDLGIDPAYLARAKAEQMALMGRRRALYTPRRGPIEARGRLCIVVDDGLATGSTMIAALNSVRTREPARLVCAVPVASRESLARIGHLADEVVCLSQPPEFHAVGQFYADFTAVSDEEVARILGAHEPVH